MIPTSFFVDIYIFLLGGSKMDNKSNLTQLRYLEEMTINLKRVGFEVGRIKDQRASSQAP